MQTKIDLIGVPSNLGGKNNGVDRGPDYLRSYKIIHKLKSTGLNINDLGNTISFNRNEIAVISPSEKYAPQIEEITQDLKIKITNSLNAKNKVITIGGDHSLVIGSIGAAANYQAKNNKSLGIIWIDAHPDLNTPKSSLSGFIHGMGLRMNLINHKTAVNDKNLILIGLKDIDYSEQEYINNNNLKSFSTKDILLDGLRPVLQEISLLKNNVDNIWVSFDLDSIDRDYAPGVGIPNKGGLTYREAINLAAFIGSEIKEKLMGIDLVEYNPDYDQNNKTAELAIELAACLLNKEFSSYTNYMNSL